MRVSNVLRIKGNDVQTVEPSHTIADAIQRLQETRVRSMVVTDDDRVVGVITVRDILAHLAQRGGDAMQDPVRKAMTADVVTVTPDTMLKDADALFSRKRFNHLPVVRDGKLVGVVTPADVLMGHLRDVQDTNEYLIGYISGGYY